MQSLIRTIGNEQLPLFSNSKYGVSNYSNLDKQWQPLILDRAIRLIAERAVEQKYGHLLITPTSIKVNDNLVMSQHHSQLMNNYQLATTIQSQENPTVTIEHKGYFIGIVPTIEFITNNSNQSSFKGEMKIFFTVVGIKMEDFCSWNKPKVRQPVKMGNYLFQCRNNQLTIDGTNINKWLLPREQQRHDRAIEALKETLAKQPHSLEVRHLLSNTFLEGKYLRVDCYSSSFSMQDLNNIVENITDQNEMVLVVWGKINVAKDAAFIYYHNGMAYTIGLKNGMEVSEILHEIDEHQRKYNLNFQPQRKKSSNARHSTIESEQSTPVCYPSIYVYPYQNQQLIERIAKHWGYINYRPSFTSEFMSPQRIDELSWNEYKELAAYLRDIILMLAAAPEIHDKKNRKLKAYACCANDSPNDRDNDNSYNTNSYINDQMDSLPIQNFSIEEAVNVDAINIKKLQNKRLLMRDAYLSYDDYMPKRNLWDKFCFWVSQNKRLTAYIIISIILIALSIFIPWLAFPALLITLKSAFATEVAALAISYTVSIVWGGFTAAVGIVWGFIKGIAKCCCMQAHDIDDDRNLPVIRNQHALQSSNSPQMSLSNMSTKLLDDDINHKNYHTYDDDNNSNDRFEEQQQYIPYGKQENNNTDDKPYLAILPNRNNSRLTLVPATVFHVQNSDQRQESLIIVDNEIDNKVDNFNENLSKKQLKSSYIKPKKKNIESSNSRFNNPTSTVNIVDSDDDGNNDSLSVHSYNAE